MNRRGFMFADAMVGLFLISVIAGVVAVSESGFQRFGNALAAQRTALRHAEQAVAALQSNQPPAAEWNATITPLPTSAPTGLHWVRVEAVENEHHAELFALTKGPQ